MLFDQLPSQTMNKTRIKIVTLGHLPLHVSVNRAATWKSRVFETVGPIENFALRCDSDGAAWEYSDEALSRQLPSTFDAHFLVAIVNVPIEGNWYSRRLDKNRIVFTFHEIREFLWQENIPLENAVLRILYAYSLLYRRANNSIPCQGTGPTFTHDETRGCLFDMNGIKYNLVESCNKPRICEECEERLRNDRVSTDTIRSVQREIKGIKKTLYYRALDFVKVRPLSSLVISSLFAITLGVTGSLIASVMYDRIKADAETVLETKFR